MRKSLSRTTKVVIGMMDFYNFLAYKTLNRKAPNEHSVLISNRKTLKS